MTRSVVTAGLCAAVVFLAMGTAHAQICTEWMLDGEYAFLRRGYTVVDAEGPPQPSVSLGITAINHLGETNGSGTVKVPAMDHAYATQGKIDLESDCSYVETIELTTPSGDSMEITERCMVHNGGAEIYCAGTHSGASYATVGKRLATPGSCSVRMLEGTFGLTCQGVVTLSPEAGPMQFASSGTMKVDHMGRYTAVGAGSVIAAGFQSVAEGTVTVNEDCTVALSQLYNEESAMNAVGVLVSLNEMFTRTGDPGAAYACHWRRVHSR